MSTPTSYTAPPPPPRGGNQQGRQGGGLGTAGAGLPAGAAGAAQPAQQSRLSQFTPPPAPGTAAARRARRPGMIFAGLGLAAVFGLAAGYMTLQAGARNQVLALAHAVPYGHRITTDDLTVARIADDPALSPVAAGDESSIVGQYAATNLSAGSLLTRADVTPSVVPAGQSVVGVGLKPGQMPAGGVHSQDRVMAMGNPGVNDDPSKSMPAPIHATVVSVSDPDGNGLTVVSLLVSIGDASQLSAWNATGRVSLAIEPRT